MEKNDSALFDLFNGVRDVVIEKDRNYKSAFDSTLDKYGLVALCIRLTDKLNRLDNMVSHGWLHDSHESLRDTLMDICGYAMLGIRHLDKERAGRVDA
jgi:hypothetical protein